MAETKTASNQDVLDAFAKAVGKDVKQFGVQEFENVDGEQSLAIVDLVSGSICLQANGDNGARRLLDAIEEGTLTFVDPAKAPKSNPLPGREQGPGYGGADVKTSTGVKDISKDTDGITSVNKPADEVWAELPRNDRGQVVIDENNNIVGADESPLAGRTEVPAREDPAAKTVDDSDDKKTASAKTSTPKSSSSSSSSTGSSTGTTSATTTRTSGDGSTPPSSSSSTSTTPGQNS